MRRVWLAVSGPRCSAASLSVYARSTAAHMRALQARDSQRGLGTSVSIVQKVCRTMAILARRLTELKAVGRVARDDAQPSGSAAGPSAVPDKLPLAGADTDWREFRARLVASQVRSTSSGSRSRGLWTYKWYCWWCRQSSRGHIYFIGRLLGVGTNYHCSMEGVLQRLHRSICQPPDSRPVCAYAHKCGKRCEHWCMYAVSVHMQGALVFVGRHRV